MVNLKSPARWYSFEQFLWWPSLEAWLAERSVSELTANAVPDRRPPFELVVDRWSDRVHASVLDTSTIERWSS
jgi:hypothetical protein